MSEPTQADREKVEAIMQEFCPYNHNPASQVGGTLLVNECVDCLASELAAARREGERIEHKRVCGMCVQNRVMNLENPCERIKQLEEGK